MKKRQIIFSFTARADLALIESWVAENAGATIASKYSRRILSFCQRLETGSERGTKRDEIRLSLRVIGFEKRVNILFVVTPGDVTILRIFYGGQNWQAAFDEEV
jgi:toxin ParE1/3/4